MLLSSLLSNHLNVSENAYSKAKMRKGRNLSLPHSTLTRRQDNFVFFNSKALFHGNYKELIKIVALPTLPILAYAHFTFKHTYCFHIYMKKSISKSI